MNWFSLRWIVLSFCATPGILDGYVLAAGDWRAHRKMKSLDPGLPRDDPPGEIPALPVEPIPTDVPMPEPHDVPARTPKDVPPPDPKPRPVP
jgi:hypothetical protein